MPVATVIQVSKRFGLKTLKEGFIVVRRMTYGEKMQRLEMTGKLKLLSNKNDKEALGEINMMNKLVTEWEFAHLVLEHNLEHQDNPPDGPTRPLNFKDPADVHRLAGNIGEEIATRIDEMNNFEDEDETKNSSTTSGSSSS